MFDAEFIPKDTFRRKPGWINDDRGPAPVDVKTQFQNWQTSLQ